MGAKNRDRRAAATADRRRRVVELRAARMTWQQIADSVGYRSKSAAFGAFQVALKEQPAEAVHELRLLELESLDRAERALWPDIRPVAQDDHAGARRRDFAIDRLLRIKERRAALLGLDAPARTDLRVSSEELRAQLREEAREVATQMGLDPHDFDLDDVLKGANEILQRAQRRARQDGSDGADR